MINSKNKIILSALLLTIVISLIFESILIDKISLLIILISLLYLGYKEKTFINPYNLFSLTPLSLLIYFNISDNYMLDLTHDTYLLAIINIISFIIAFYVTPRSNLKIIIERHSLWYENKTDLRVYTFILFGFSFTGLLIPQLASVSWLLAIPAIVSAIKTKEKLMMIVVVAYIIFTSSHISKMGILIYLITLIISFDKYFLVLKKNGFRLKLLTGLSIFFLIFSFNFANKERGAYEADVGLSYYASQGVEWEYSSALFLPYIYFTSPWANLQYVTETQNKRTNGLWTIKPFIGYFGLDEYVKSEYNLASYSSFNTFTFITIGFKDYGYWFSILPTLLIGFLTKRVYSRYLVSSSPIHISTYIIFSIGLLLMFFSNHFYMQSYPFTMLVLMCILRLKIYSS